jgi:hypothetical protein
LLPGGYDRAMVKREDVRLELLPSAKTALENIAHQRGMKQSSLLERLIEWFATTREPMHPLVLGLIPEEIRMDCAEIILKHHQHKRK